MSEVDTGLLRSSAVMAIGTTLSRALGFVRSAMIVAAVGSVNLHADIFTYANTVPNMLYILVAGGVFNAVLVPQIVRATKGDPDGGAAYVNRILTLGGLALTGITAALIAAVPWVMRVLAGEELFADDLSAQTESFLDFARYCMPQVFFYGVFVLIGQVLNARNRFGPMMWAPIGNNLVSIAILAAYLMAYGGKSGDMAYSTGEELVLGLGSTFGIVVQTAILIPYLRKAGVRYRPRFDLRGSGLGHTLRLGMWTVLFVVVNQIAYVVVGRIATNASSSAALTGETSSGFTAYNFAFLLLMVPHGIITVSLATAVLPRLSGLAADGELAQSGRELSSTLRHALAWILPFCTVLAVLGPSLAVVMFSWGAAEGDAGPLGRTLVVFSPALVFFTVHYLMLRGFYAVEDTRTVFFVQCGVAATNIVAAVLLTDPTGSPDVAPWLAAAYGVAYLVGSTLSLLVLRRRLGDLDLGALFRFVARLAIVCVPTAGVAWLAAAGVSAAGADPDTKPGALLLLGVAGALALGVLLLGARLMRLSEVTGLVGSIMGRLRR
ncbi:MAG: murein biosynthesis integral membrane protein MurJ [Propionibacteriales bacterium]|nr:murein biosynthesis integral membrane protein MurJ [Propionibacteriales bacterium]